MCVIIATYKRPSLKLLQQAESANLDGGGMAWLADGKVHWKKGITALEMHAMTKELEPPFICHFRIATIGGRGKGLTHPFPIGGSVALEGATKGAVIFHNGHYRDWEDRVFSNLANDTYPAGNMSDTRAIAWLSKTWGVNWLDLIAGTANKFAVLHANGKIDYHGAWLKHDEQTWVSNKNFCVTNNWSKFDKAKKQAATFNSHQSYNSYNDYVANRVTSTSNLSVSDLVAEGIATEVDGIAYGADGEVIEASEDFEQYLNSFDEIEADELLDGPDIGSMTDAQWEAHNRAMTNAVVLGIDKVDGLPIQTKIAALNTLQEAGITLDTKEDKIAT